MKTLKYFSFLLLLTGFVNFSYAQKIVSEKVAVAGNCGMCKTSIEKAAKSVDGVKEAEWDKEKKELKVKFESESANLAKIQESIAAVGYDTRDFKATDEKYNKLPGCCKYERMSHESTHAAKAACCKDGKCTMEGHDGKDCCKMEDGKKMDCCKDGKCTMAGHDGKDCCQKSH